MGSPGPPPGSAPNITDVRVAELMGDESGRPDRRALGRPLDDELVRSRLIDLLAQRWNVPLVVVEAPGGYGKSTAIAQAIRDNDDDPSGIDVYVRCRSSFADVAAIAGEVVRALGGPEETSAVSADRAVAVVAGVIADASPNDICVHLDDVHALPDAEAATAFLDELLRELPANGHLLLAGRRIPTLRLTRLRAADGVIDVRADDLAFDPDELRSLAARHDADPASLTAAAGWPALTRLSLTLGTDVSGDYLVEEIVDGLSADERRAVAVAVVAGSADGELLRACGVGASVSELLRSVPLLVDYADGSFGAHDIWADVLDRLVDTDGRASIAGAVVDQRAASGQRHAAVDLALRAGLWERARAEILAILASNDADVTAESTARWLAALPPEQHDEPEIQLLRGMAVRFTADPAEGVELVRAAADAFRERGDIDGETCAAMELGVRSWLLNDPELRADINERSRRIIAAGGERMRLQELAGRAIAADTRGEFRKALEYYDRMGEARSELELRHSSTLALLLGEPDRAIEFLDVLQERYPKPIVSANAMMVRWLSGHPEEVLRSQRRLLGDVDMRRNQLLVAVHESMIGASLGVVPEVELVDQLAWQRSRERTFQAFVHAAHALLVAGEADASAELERRLTDIGLDDPLLRGELRRWLPYAYVLSPSARAWLDTDAELGPLHERTRALARTLVRARDGAGAPVGELPDAPQILAWFPLPWSVELAVRLAEAGDPRGVGLAEYLADLCGAVVHEQLRRFATVDGLRAGADALLAVVPAPPSETTVVEVCGAATAVRRGHDVILINRTRVRQLLQLLVLDDELGRAALVDALWPELDERKGRANLRVTLMYLRNELEPDRRAGEAFFHLRQRGERVWLQRSDTIEVDAWQLDDSLSRGEAAQAAGRDDEAIEAFEQVVARWHPQAFADVRDLPLAARRVDELEQRIVRAACWMAERLLSRGRVDDTLRLAGALLDQHPLLERAHDVVVGAHLSTGDLDAAGAAIDRCLDALTELGAPPSSATDMLIRRYERRSGRLVTHPAVRHPDAV